MTENVTDPKAHVERLIQRVRTMMDMGLTIEEIVEACSDHHPGGEIYLAWHAAKILIANERTSGLSSDEDQEQ